MDYDQYDSLALNQSDPNVNEFNPWLNIDDQLVDDKLRKIENLDNENEDENSYKKFLEFEHQQQQAQLSKLLKEKQPQNIDESYIGKGEIEDNLGNEESNVINQCQQDNLEILENNNLDMLDKNLDSNYNQIKLANNMLHCTNGIGEVYTIPEETEDELTSSPDSLVIKQNLKNLDESTLMNSVTKINQPLETNLRLASIENSNNLQSNLHQPESIQITQTKNQTVENLINTNDQLKFNPNDNLNQMQSTHRKLPQTGALASEVTTSSITNAITSSINSSATSLTADHWNQAKYNLTEEQFSRGKLTLLKKT